MPIDASTYFNAENMDAYFKRKLQKKKGGGRDHLSPDKFYAKYQASFGEIAKQCLDGTYRFSCYNEKLVLKGAGKLPRVLSIPSMKDRLVLGVLNDYLSDEFRDCVRGEVPNKLMGDVVDMMKSTEQKVYYLRTDFHDFYGSVSIKLLMNMLSSRITDEHLIELVYRAITTLTISGHKPSGIIHRPKYGIPQGLAISNILAAIYMKSFDDEFAMNYAQLYIRYVDDILFLNPKLPILKRPMLKEIQRRNLRLRLSTAKCKQGIVGTSDIDFLGYVIKDKNKVFVREKSVTRFLSRIAALAARCRDGWENKDNRQPFIRDDDAYVEYYKEELNQLISGFRHGRVAYGWMAYFQGITDVASLYGMDRVIHERIFKKLPETITNDVNKLVDTYYALRRKSGGSLVKDYDDFTDVESKRRFLLRKGWIREYVEYTPEQIENYFDRYLDFIKKRELRNIGAIS